ncbi:MAG: hypothetical protein AAF799_32950 [Myxococcota bacterium]
MTSSSLRMLGAAVLGLTLLTGVFLSGKARRDTEQRLEDLHAGVERTEREVEARGEPPPVALEENPEQFAMRLAEDVKTFALEPVTVEALGQPNAYFNELPEPVVLGNKKTWTSAHLKIKVHLDRVNYMQHGARVSSVHSLARIENISTVPIAYRAILRGEKGKCEVRGAREHNAVTLVPGESAEIVVCAGRDRVKIEAVEVLEVSPLGHYYLSQISPRALGLDATSDAGHRPSISVPKCTKLDTKALLGYLQAGTAKWADIVDFYSRHNCHRLDFFPGYRRAEAPLDGLPVVRPR